MFKSRFLSHFQSDWFIIFLILIINVFLKIPYFTLPVNRDTGTFLYAGQEIIRGKTIYVDFVDHKPPLSYLFAAFFAFVSNNSIYFIRIFTLITVIISALLVFKIGYKFTNSRLCGYFSGIIYSLFISMPLTWSFDFMTTNFMEIFGLLSIFFILDNDNKWNLFMSGVMIGLSAISKPPGIVYLLIVFLTILIREHQYQSIIKKFIYIIIGLGFISITIAILLLQNNILKEFIYWTFQRNVFLRPFPFSTKLSIFSTTVLRDNYLLYFAAFCCILFTFAYYNGQKKPNLMTIVSCIFWIFAFILFYTFTPQIQTHYFYSLIAPLSIIAAIFFGSAAINNKTRTVLLLIFFTIFHFNYGVQINNFSHEIVFSATGLDLKEQEQISSDIRNLTNPNEKVLILFSSPEYYYLSNREASTPYPQFNENYLSNTESFRIINNLISHKLQKIILIRHNDWGYLNISTEEFNRNYSLYKTYSNTSVELYILKNN